MWLLTSRATKEKRAAVVNIIQAMKAKGQIGSSEMKILTKACQEAKISKRKLTKLIQKSSPRHLNPPRNTEEKMRFMADAIFTLLDNGDPLGLFVPVPKRGSMGTRKGHSPDRMVKRQSGWNRPNRLVFRARRKCGAGLTSSGSFYQYL